jgi:C4-dicarboxylate transporter, DctQ subunit
VASFLYTAVRRLTDAAAAVAAASVLLSLVLVCYSVAMRYLAGAPEPWVDEMVGYVLVASVMFAVAEALRRGEHISVDLLTQRLGPRARRGAHVLGLVAVAASAAILLVEGWDMVAFSRMVGIRSVGYLDLPIWTVQAMVPLGGALLLLAALAELLRGATEPPAKQDKD